MHGLTSIQRACVTGDVNRIKALVATGAKYNEPLRPVDKNRVCIDHGNGGKSGWYDLDGRTPFGLMLAFSDREHWEATGLHLIPGIKTSRTDCIPIPILRELDYVQKKAGIRKTSVLWAFGALFLGFLAIPVSVMVIFYKIMYSTLGFSNALKALPWPSPSSEYFNIVTPGTVICCMWLPILPLFGGIFLFDDSNAVWAVMTPVLLGLLFIPFMLYHMLYAEINPAEYPISAPLKQTEDIGGALRHVKDPRTWQWSWANKYNILGLASAFWEFYQVFSFANPPEVYPPNAPTSYIFSFAVFDLSIVIMKETAITIEFLVIFILVMFWLSLSSVFLYSAVQSNYKFVGRIPGSNFLIHLFTIDLYLIIVERLLTWIACNDLSSYMTCWQDQHKFYGTFAAVCLVVYHVSVSYIGTISMETFDPQVDIRWVEAYTLIERNFKFLILLVTVFFLPNHQSAGLVIQSIIFGMMARIIYKQSRSHNYPCSVHALGDLRCIYYTMCSWASAMGFCSSFASKTNWIPYIIMNIGLIPIIIIGKMVLFPSSTRGCLRFVESVEAWEIRQPPKRAGG